MIDIHKEKCKQEEEILNKAILQRTVAAGVATTMGVSMVGCSINNKEEVSLDNSISTNIIKEQIIETNTTTYEKPIITNNKNETHNFENKDDFANFDNVVEVQSNLVNDNGNSINNPTNTIIPTIIEKTTNEPISTNIPTPTSILVPTSTPMLTNAPTAGTTNIPSITSTPMPTNAPTPISTPKPTTKPTIVVTPTPIAMVTPIVIPDPIGNIVEDDDDNSGDNGGNIDIGELTGLVVIAPTPTPTPEPENADIVIPDPTGNLISGPTAPELTGNVVTIPEQTPTPTIPYFPPLTGDVQIIP